MTTGKTIALSRWTFVGKVMSLLFNMLSRLFIAFLPNTKHLLISWLQSQSAVILEPMKIKSITVSLFHHAYSFSHVQLFVTPWTAARQAPLSMGFPRQEYWSGLPFLYPGDLLHPGIECLLHCRQILYCLSHQGRLNLRLGFEKSSPFHPVFWSS